MATNVRLRPLVRGQIAKTLVLRPQRAIGGITRTPSGAVLVEAYAKVFKSGTDVKVADEISDSQGRYTGGVPDALKYYTLALQLGTCDAVIPTCDNTTIKADRSTGVGGVTVTSLQGVA